MPRKLSDITLIVIDSVAHDLTREAIKDTLREIEPYEVIVWSGTPLIVGVDATWIQNDARSYEDVARILWYEVPKRVKTSHFLVIQYDGFVLNAQLWNPEWLELDYIGAPWPWHNDTRRVGNGGFSLRSTQLARFIANHPNRYPMRHPEDDTLCRQHRVELDHLGFLWATLAQARAFSFERDTPHETFGFHGLFNLPHVMNRDRLSQRLELANDYVRNKLEWRELFNASIKKLAV